MYAYAGVAKFTSKNAQIRGACACVYIYIYEICTYIYIHIRARVCMYKYICDYVYIYNFCMGSIIRILP